MTIHPTERERLIRVQNSQSEGSDLIGSNTAEAEEDADPSNEAEDCSC